MYGGRLTLENKKTDSANVFTSLMTTNSDRVMIHLGRYNGPFPSSLGPLLQSKSECETILMEMTLICMKMKLHAELIFI